MAFLDKHSEKKHVVAPKRGFYSEAVANAPLVEEARAASLGLSAPPKRAKLAWQVRTEVYAPVIARISPAPAPSPRTTTKDLWVAAEDEWGNVIPLELWGPTLPTMEEAEMTQIPRQISIERQLREYAHLNVRDLLQDVPIELLDPPVKDTTCQGLYDASTFLPLDIFDDEEYDCRTWQEWLELGSDKLAVEAYVPDGQGYRWVEGSVVDYDPALRRYTVVDAAQSEYRVPRLYVRFRAENPVLYCQRLKDAIEMREEAEADIRFHLFVDCMPVEDMQEMDQNSLERILRWGVRDGALKVLDDYSVERVEQQVRYVFKRTMCQLMLIAEAQRHPAVYEFLTVPQRLVYQGDMAPQARGTVEVVIADYPERLAHAYWGNLFAIPEAYVGLSLVAQDCDKAAESQLFTAAFGKNVSLDEFAALQTQTTTNVIRNLQTQWVQRVADNIRLCLRDVGKGWYNLRERSWDIYLISKMRRLLSVTSLRMESALCLMVTRSVAQLVSIVCPACQCCLEVQEDFVWGEDLVESPFKSSSAPVFQLYLKMEDAGPYLSTRPEQFHETVLQLFDDAVLAAHSIKSVEPVLMTNLVFPNDLKLPCVELLDPEVQQQRQRLAEGLLRAAILLRAYCDEYHRYLDFHNLKVADYISDFQSEDHTAAEFKVELQQRKQMKEDLLVKVPVTITIGPFLVNVDVTRTNLLNKCQEVMDKMLQMFAARLRQQVDEVLEEFTEIMTKVLQRPNSIEHVMEIREFLESAPYLISAQEDIARKLLLDYEMLDTFFFALSDDDFRAKWEMVGWPHNLSKMMGKATEKLTEETKNFLQLHNGDEAAQQQQIEFLTERVVQLQGESNFDKVHELAIEIGRIWKLMKETQEQGLLLNRRQKVFGVPVTPYEDLNRLVKEFQPYRDLWITAAEWAQAREIWSDNPLVNVDGDAVERLMSEGYKTMTRLTRTFAEIPQVQKVAVDVKEAIDAFRPSVPLLMALRDPGLRQRHFDQLKAETGVNIKLTPNLTFKMCLEAGVARHVDRVAVLAETAAKEYAIESTLDKIESEWEEVKMDVQPYKATGTYIMKVSDEELQMLDDHILTVQQMSFSPFVGMFEKKVAETEARLRLMSEVLEEWIQLQIQWMYLEPIFCSEDIGHQLPSEMKKYSTMERFWRRIMKTASDYPKVIAICPDKRLLEQLKENRLLLEQVLKGLSEYLEDKRTAFPRFYFLSDGELLEILAQNRNPLAVQPHLRKCFENIARLHFEEDLQITTMFSAEGESVELIPPMYPSHNVEDWLNKVEETMRSTVQETLALALSDMGVGEEGRPAGQQKRAEWVLRWPGQVVIAGCQAAWTAGVEEGIRDNTLPAIQTTMHAYMDTYRRMVHGKLSRMERQVMSALIVIEVHARDRLDFLVEQGTTSVNDFDWISQLRYYWDETLKVRAVNAEFQYGYEYLGNSGRLVITPLTDRCYLTLTGALHLNFGGAPAGPAGTGKTESTKDLAKAMAIQCVVFNCSDQLDVQAMGKFFKGIASAGAWACFDEFNRIDIEVLSVVAQQVISIQKAQAARMQRFMFEGVEIALRPGAAVFITMNPGYAGRTELPDNLKALFRPVAMMVPNYTLITEISLFSFGFSGARELANKITTTFKLSSEQLSSQDHYDFGMRTVKTVITVAGNLKREEPDMSEPQIVKRAIRDVNVPKFLREDLILFNGIVSDLFPRLKEEQVDYGILVETIRNVCDQKGLQAVDEFVQKVIQLYDTTVVRHGLMLVGPTGSGKTKCYEVLRESVTALSGKQSPSGTPFTPVHTYVMNPKAITMGQLYGELDAVTHEWTDGILPSLVRAGAGAQDADKRWYVFDGPVDAVWIENMNTVLDDNKKLCLSSGEIIKLTEHMTMVFEVADLAVASPATVSRCGMVYLEPSALGLQPFLESWLRTLPQHGKDTHPRLVEDLRALLTTYLLGGVAFLRSSLVEILESQDVCLVQGCLRLLDARLAPLQGPRPPPPAAHLLAGLLVPWVVLAVVWSVGATCDNASRNKFSAWLQSTMLRNQHGPAFPTDGLVYDYKLHDGGFQDQTEDGEPTPPQWLHWMHDEDPYVIPEDARYSDMEVPTLDTVRNACLLELLVTRGHSVACVGPTGTGKTLTVVAKLSRGLPNKYIADFLCFSARTSANQTQDVIDAKLDRRRKGVFGPPPNRKQLLFIDDFNMPALDAYGAQPPIELIRQWLDFQGWYDRKAVGEFRQIVDVSLVVAMGPPGGGRNPVTARVMRHFHYLAFTELEDSSKITIFGTITRWWLSRTPGLAGEVERLVRATLDVYALVLKELLPTPTKTHYTFNLRDLSKVFQGVLMANPAQVQDLDQLLLLWYHENLRVYQDRLVSDKDRGWFSERLKAVLRSRFNCDPLGPELLYYGDLTNPKREYIRITDTDKLSQVLLEMLDDYNSQSTAPMRLVLFTDAMQHVCRVARILRQPQGNGLLLGMGGSGRQSLTRLAAFASELPCFQVELSRAYGPAEWREDLKQLLLKAGLHMRETVFLFSDTQIKSESFLEDLNSVLNAGDVPNIYKPEELDKIYQLMRGVVTDQGLQATRSNMFSAYQRTVKNNLHCIIVMSPVGDMFRARLRMFPALVNCCTIDWFSPWPDSALQSVATRFLSEVPGIEDAMRAPMVSMCQVIHSSVLEASERFVQELSRHYYVTATSYLELLNSYSEILVKKRAELEQGIARLTKGLDKLHATAAVVAALQKDLSAMKPALLRAQQETSAMLDKIAADTARVERTKQETEMKEAIASEKSTACAAIAADAEQDLAEAMPALLEAERSLKALNKNDISEVRALKKPPAGVVLVIEAICIAMGVAPNRVPGPKLGEKVNDFWTPGTALLANPDHFLNSLVNYDKENVPEDTIKKLKPYIEDPQFQPSSVVKVSKACGSLCVWTHAIYKFYFVYLVVRPKKEKLAEANKELEATNQQLQVMRDRIAQILSGLAALQEELRVTEERKAELEARAQQCEDRMDRARRLLGGVASERGRWEATVVSLQQGTKLLLGDILISAGAVTYLTPFTDRYRRALLQRWLSALQEAGVPHQPACSPVDTLSEPVQIRLWQVDGLPRDALSTESAVLVAHSKRCPLFIDPQGQANRWIRNMFKDKELVVLKLSDSHLIRALETAIRFGFPALLEGVGEELDPALEPVLARATFKQGASLVMKLGDVLVPYNANFRLYITTKLPNPHYLPEVATRVLLVNFALVPSGLTDQLLSLVVLEERPDLEEAHSAIVTSTAQMKLELKEMEDRTLELLAASEGSPVDDIDLILSLEASKHKSDEILAKVEASEETQREIDQTRAGYLPVANRAQLLYFCLTDLSRLDPMYQYSLEWFTAIFVGSIRSSKQEGVEQQRRIRSVNEAFTFALYCNVCRSLFERHKLWFAVLLCTRILLDLGRVQQAEWQFLLAPGKPDSAEPNPAAAWLSARAWSELLAMRKLERLREFAESIPSSLDHYKAVFDSTQPQREPLPEPWQSRLDGFQRLLLLRALRPDKLADGLQEWLSRTLGSRFVEPQASDVATMFKDASPTIPLVFVLAAGTDPAQDLFVFADKMRMSKRLGMISMGQGQGLRAERMFLQAVEEGSWVFFQNCHLAPSWMPRLEQLLEGLSEDSVHRDFRMWLTSTPSPAFPVSILQASSKMTVEPPRGVKANLMRAFQNQLAEFGDFFDSEHFKAMPFRRLSLSLALFHAVILERRKFGPLGFNIPYEFTEGDLRICVSQLHMFLLEYHDVPFKVLCYTAGQINYGGRVTDDWDRRTIGYLLSRHYDEEVLRAEHQFSSDYKQLPDAALLKDYVSHARSLPLSDDPQLFGLHPNADISCAQSTTYAGLAALQSLQPRTSVGGGVGGGAGGGAGGGEDCTTAEQDTMEAAMAILKQIPKPMELKPIMNKYPVRYEESFNTVLVQEVVRFNQLLGLVARSLQDLMRALQGLVVMSAALEAQAEALAANTVPPLWAAKAYPSLKPLGAWVADLKSRISFLQSWVEQGIPSAFWISGFFFPQAFLTGTLQNYARKNVVSIDTIGFAFRVLKDLPSARPAEGCVIYGLFMEGARWSAERAVVDESFPKELHTAMPPVLLLPEPHHKEAEAGLYLCPVYKTLQRAGVLSTTGHSTNYVLTVELPSQQPQGHWIGRGVALVCALDY